MDTRTSGDATLAQGVTKDNGACQAALQSLQAGRAAPSLMLVTCFEGPALPTCQDALMIRAPAL